MTEKHLQRSLDEDPRRLWLLLEDFPLPLDATLGSSCLSQWLSGSLEDWARYCRACLPPEGSPQAFARSCSRHRIWRVPGAATEILGALSRGPHKGASLRSALLESVGASLSESDPADSAWAAELPSSEARLYAEALVGALWLQALHLTEGVGRSRGPGTFPVRPGWLLALPAAGDLLMEKTRESSPERAWGLLVAKALLAKYDGGRPLHWAGDGVFDCLADSDWGPGGRPSAEWACGSFRDAAASDPNLSQLLSRHLPRLLPRLEPWLIGSQAARGLEGKSRPRKA